jgi:Trk K+ transport system NAD-binding subunit
MTSPAPPGPADRHVLVYGLTGLAVRIAEQLTLSGVACLVLDDRSGDRAAQRLRARLAELGVPTAAASGSVNASLVEAGIGDAQAVIATADSDIDNLEVALHAAELAEGVRIVVQLNNARLGAELQASLPNARVLSLGDRAGPGFVEACVQSDVLHAFRLGPQPLVVIDVGVHRRSSCRELFGTLTPITLRRLDPDLPLELCPGRDVPVGPGDRVSLLGRPEDFAAHGIPGGAPETVDALVALSSGEVRDAPRPRRTLRGELESLRASVTALGSEVDRPVRLAAGIVMSIVVLSTVLLRFTYHNYSVTDAAGRPIQFGWLQAFYFTTTIVATVGFGDFSFARESGWVIAYGTFLILVGAAAVATLYALVTNFVLSQRLEQAFGRKRAITARGHIVVVGLGSIGLAVVEGLLGIGRDVVVVEHDGGNRNLGAARARKVPVVIGDATDRTVLRQANVDDAAAVAVMTSSDLANVESALSARAAHAAVRPDRPRLRVVVRIFDTALADKVQKRFGVSVVRSASALAAPWFVGAALGYEVVSTFYAQRQPFLVARMRVAAGGGLDGTQLADMGGGLRMVAASPPEDDGDAEAGGVEDVGEEAADYRLTRHTRLQAGSEVLMVGTYSTVIGAFRANEPGALRSPAG